jgi:cytochrome P450
MDQDAQPAPPFVFNPFSPETIANPYAFYDRMRDFDPVFMTPFGYWFATRHEDVSFVVRDPRLGKNFAADMQKLYGPRALEEPVLGTMNRMMLILDPPDHTKARSLMAKAFTATLVPDLRPHIQSVAETLIHSVRPHGQMDLIRDFAFVLPITVITGMLGIPEQDRQRFIASFKLSGRMLDGVPMSRSEMDEMNTQMEFLREYFVRLFDARRRNPGSDLTTRLVQAEANGEGLSEEELVANLILLFAAGYETTCNLIGNALLALFQHPRELDRVKRDPGLLAKAGDELLRYCPPAQFTARTAKEDVKLGDKLVKKGDFVVASLAAANRDPSVYEKPHELNLARENVRPLSFGGGIHFCLGAQLARLELEIAIATLVRMIPSLQLTDLENPKWKTSFVWRGLDALPATWQCDGASSNL